MERKALIHNLIKDIDIRKKIYEKRMYRLKRIDDISEAIISLCGVTSSSLLLVGLSTVNPILMLIGTVSGILSTISGTVKNAYKVKDKFEACKTTYLNLNELSRESKIIMMRNHLSATDLQQLLSDISHKLSLIDDTAPPINESAHIATKNN